MHIKNLEETESYQIVSGFVSGRIGSYRGPYRVWEKHTDWYTEQGYYS